MKYHWTLILLCSLSCNTNRYYTTTKSGFHHYYCVKQHRADNLRLLIYEAGVPHWSYTYVYATESGEILKIIKDRDGIDFYQAITNIHESTCYFNGQEVIALDANRMGLFDTKDLTKGSGCGRCSDLKFPGVMGTVMVARPRDFVQHLGHKRFLRKG